METSLHRELKARYAGTGAQIEVPLDSYRIDAVVDGTLVEIQHGKLAAIRDKIARLVESHAVLVVKPIVARKTLVRRNTKGGRVVSRRLSPKRGRVLDFFDELVHFTRVFPHPNLVVETPLVEVEEWRYPGHGRRRRWRKDDFLVEDQLLVGVESVQRFATTADLIALLPPTLPAPFHTAHLAADLGVPRWLAQRIAYCLAQTGAARQVGKERNARLYELIVPAAKAA